MKPSKAVLGQSWQGLSFSLAARLPAHQLPLVRPSGTSFQGLLLGLKRPKPLEQEEEEGSGGDFERPDPGVKVGGW